MHAKESLERVAYIAYILDLY